MTNKLLQYFDTKWDWSLTKHSSRPGICVKRLRTSGKGSPLASESALPKYKADQNFRAICDHLDDIGRSLDVNAT